MCDEMKIVINEYCSSTVDIPDRECLHALWVCARLRVFKSRDRVVPIVSRVRTHAH